MGKLRHFLFEIRAIALAWFTYAKWWIRPYQPLGLARGESALRVPSGPDRGKLRIVHVNTDDMSGGAAKIARELCEAQRNSGHDSHLLVNQKKLNEPYSIELEKNATRKQHFLAYAQKKLAWQDFFHLSSFEITQTPIIEQADIVHLHNLHGDYFSYLSLPSLSQKKHLVWSLHDMHPLTGHCSYSLSCEKWKKHCGGCPDLGIYPSVSKDTTRFIHKTKARSYKKSHLHIVVLSEWMRGLVQKSALKDHHIHLIYNGIDTSVFYPREQSEIRHKLSLPSDKKIILFSANLGAGNPFKGGE